MTAQLALDLSPLTEPDYEPTLTLDERYALWIEANPHVLPAFEALADKWLARRPRLGVKFLAEILRYQTGIQTTGDVWVINNSYTSRIARDLLRRRPEWEQKIQTRRLAGER